MCARPWWRLAGPSGPSSSSSRPIATRGSAASSRGGSFRSPRSPSRSRCRPRGGSTKRARRVNGDSCDRRRRRWAPSPFLAVRDREMMTRPLPVVSRSFLTATLVAGLASAACTSAPATAVGAAPAATSARPALVVMVVVDQLREPLLDRYDDLFTGGFRRLLDQGRFYTNATHDH